MSEHIKTGKEISDILSDEMVSRFQKGSLDLTRLNVLESEQWVSLSWLKEQIKDELTAHDHDPQDITSYYAGLKWFLSLLEEKPMNHKLGDREQNGEVNRERKRRI